MALVVCMALSTIAIAAPPVAAAAPPQQDAGAVPTQGGSGGFVLPTPLEHYEEYNAAAAARALLPRVALSLDQETLQRIMALAGPDPANARPTISAAEALELLERIDIEPWRDDLTEMLLHSSSILELIPEESADWLPLVHDSLLVVLSGMTMDRLRARIAGQAALPADAGRGERMLAFADETPTFQKIGQIVARSPWLPEDLKAPFQSLESDIVTTGPEELIAIIEEELGERTLREYAFEFEDEVLSEASVGAVIGATVVYPDTEERRRTVIKVIKEYAIAAITEDLESTTVLLELLEEHRDFYGIGATPLVDMFTEVRSALAREIKAADERANLVNARAYFADDPRVVVPELCPCSSENVTVMERIEGVKVTDAYPDDPKQRRKLAQRLTDITMYDVMFAPGDALFHGDPHAGNVFFIGDAEDPYRIALIDWGLQGTLSYEQRVELVQVGLGLQLKDAGRLRGNVDALVIGEIDLAADGDKIDAMIATVFAAADEIKNDTGEDPGTLILLDRLASELAKGGYTVDGDILLYVKSTYTIQSVISDLDPDFKTADYVGGRVRNQVMSEMPMRLANTFWIPGMWSHEYDSMASNNDVWGSIGNSIGVGIWRAISFPFR